MSGSAHLQDDDDLAASLRVMGLVGDGEAFTVKPLSGGVSCDVLLIEAQGRAPFVVKRALP